MKNTNPWTFYKRLWLIAYMSRFASQSIILIDQNGLFKVSEAFHIHDPPSLGFFFGVAVSSRNHRISRVIFKKMSRTKNPQGIRSRARKLFTLWGALGLLCCQQIWKMQQDRVFTNFYDNLNLPLNVLTLKIFNQNLSQ